MGRKLQNKVSLLKIQFLDRNFLNFRENLKEIQQSEHFWSFQMDNEGCCRSSHGLNKAKRFASLQNLDKVLHHEPQPRLPTTCQLHKPVLDSRRDVGTETLPMCFDKSVGPEHKIRQLPSHVDEIPYFQNCSRYKPS